MPPIAVNGATNRSRSPVSPYQISLQAFFYFLVSEPARLENSGIKNLVQFDHLSNVSNALAAHNIDYDGLYTLSSQALTAAEFLESRKPKTAPATLDFPVVLRSSRDC